MAKTESYVVLSDCHVPFQDKALTKKVLKFIYELQPDGVVLAGDLLDLFSLSRHHADSLRQLKKMTLSDEYRAGSEFIIDLESVLPKKTKGKKHYIWGNHEDFYWRELDRGDRGKLGQELRSPTEALKMRERGYDVQENWKEASVTLGDHLEVIHGIYCPVHPEAKHLSEYDGSVMFGHTHRMGSRYMGKRAGFNIGGLYDKNSEAFHYMALHKRKKWTNGFAVVDIDGNGDYYTQLIQVYNGKFMADGRLY